MLLGAVWIVVGAAYLFVDVGPLRHHDRRLRSSTLRRRAERLAAQTGADPDAVLDGLVAKRQQVEAVCGALAVLVGVILVAFAAT